MRNSLKKLDSEKEKEIKLNLATLLVDINQPIEMYQFLDSFLKETEFLGFSKRLEIIKLLSKGKSYEKIQEQLNVSSATISSTAEFKNEKILKIIIKKFEIDEWAEKIAKKIGRVFK